MIKNPFDDAEEKTRLQKEYRLQCHIVERHAEYFPHIIITAFPGRPKDGADGFFKQQMGVRKGVTDILIWWGYNYPAWAIKWLTKMIQYCGFGFSLMHSGVIGLKVDAKVDAAQEKFLSAIHSLGGKEGVVRSWEEYYKLLVWWKIKPSYICTIFDSPDYRSDMEKKRDAFAMYMP